MRFEKWHGIGNAYLVLEQADAEVDLTPARVERICHPDLGAGSDGIMLIDGKPAYECKDMRVGVFPEGMAPAAA